MKKFLTLSALIAVVSVPIFADTVLQLDAGAGPGVFGIVGFDYADLGVDMNFQGAWYSSKSGIGGGFHVNAGIFFPFDPFETFVGILSVGGDFVLASQTNKGLWNIGVSVDMLLPDPKPGFHVTTGYQWAFGNSNRRFALKPSISVGMMYAIIGATGCGGGVTYGLLPFYSVSLSFNYSFNNAKTHGR
jgi:hypothetical protein